MYGDSNWQAVEAERRRLQAADLFEEGMRQSKVAEVLGVSRQAVSLWHQAWREGGSDGLLSKGPGGSSYLSAGQEAELEVLLRAGPMEHGRDDSGGRWRGSADIEERFHVTYEISGIWRLLLEESPVASKYEFIDEMRLGERLPGALELDQLGFAQPVVDPSGRCRTHLRLIRYSPRCRPRRGVRRA